MSTPQESIRIERGAAGRSVVVRFEGALDFREFAHQWDLVAGGVEAETFPVELDFAAATTLDSGSAGILFGTLGRREAAGRATRIVGATGRVRALLDLHAARHATAVANAKARAPHVSPTRIGLFDQIGRVTVALAHDVRLTFTFVGDLVVATAHAVKSPRSVNWRDLGHLLERTGADGLPIVLLINFLVGVTLAFQGAVQLKPFGANIYVADLVGKAVTRSLGPLMTAIIVAGRSGAAFAAELGTMRVSEEVDALRAMGFDPQRFLVLPRVIALFLAVPFLTLLGDLAAVLGGLLVGVTNLDLAPGTYVDRTHHALELRDVFSGVAKSLCFGLVVAVVACQKGLTTERGAEGVGRATTSAVVTIIFQVVVLEAILTVVFNRWGI